MTVDIVGKKVENQVQFWSLLGPFFILLSIAVLLFKISPHWYFPISALIGIPLCVKWKMKGMAAALCSLFLLGGISYQGLELDDRYWHVGLYLAMSFSFIVLTLSLEEVEWIVAKLQLESQSRLDNFSILDDKWKTAEKEWSLEREKNRIEIAVTKQEVAKIQEEKLNFYKIAQLAKDELVQVRNQHDQLLQDLLYKKQQIAQLNERLEETEMTIQGFVNSNSEKQIQSLTEQMEVLDQEKQILQSKMTLLQEELHSCQADKQHFSHELETSQTREQLSIMDQKRLQQSFQDLQNAFQILENKWLLVEQEKQTLLQAQIKWQQQCDQLHHLGAQHRQVIEDSQYRLQDLESRLLEGERQKEALHLSWKEIEQRLFDQQRQNKEQEERYQLALQGCLEELEKEKEKAEIEIKQIREEMALQSYTEQKCFEERYQRVLQEIELSKQSLESKNQTFIELQRKLKDLADELENQQCLFKQSSEKNHDLETLKLQLEQALQKTQTELKHAEEELQQVKQKLGSVAKRQEKLPYALGNTRQIESMYLQLKEQFQEKCQVLDSTRAELFRVNEELLKCQKEYDEEHIFDQSMQADLLQRDLVELGKEYEQMQQAYQEEIHELMDLIFSIMNFSGRK